MSENMSIKVVEDDRDRALQFVDGLRKIKSRQPDIVPIDIAKPSRDTREEVALAPGPMGRPVAIFVDTSEAGVSETAIEASVSAYVVNGLQPERVKPVRDAAIARCRMFQRMRRELAETKRALKERKLIDRAKRFSMKVRGVEEEEA
jgi:response regulator NasT